MKKASTLCQALLLLTVPVQIAYAAPVVGRKSEPNSEKVIPLIFGAKIGLANVETISDQTFSYGASVDYPLDPRIQVGATLDYWNKSSIGIEAKQAEMDDLAFGAHALLSFGKRNGSIRPFALAGLAIHRFSVSISEETSSEDPKIDRFRKIKDDVSGKLGFDLGAGANYGIEKNLDANGEILWRKLADSSVNFDQLVFSAGLSYRL